MTEIKGPGGVPTCGPVSDGKCQKCGMAVKAGISHFSFPTSEPAEESQIKLWPYQQDFIERHLTNPQDDFIKLQVQRAIHSQIPNTQEIGRVKRLNAQVKDALKENDVDRSWCVVDHASNEKITRQKELDSLAIGLPPIKSVPVEQLIKRNRDNGLL